MTIDTYILNAQILRFSIIIHLDKEVVWESRSWCYIKGDKTTKRKSIKLRDTIYTDGVGVSVLKQNYDTKKKDDSSGGKSKSTKAGEFQ